MGSCRDPFHIRAKSDPVDLTLLIHARDAVQRGPVEHSHCVSTDRDQPLPVRTETYRGDLPGCFACGITTSGQPA